MLPQRLCLLSMLLLCGCMDETEHIGFSEDLSIQAELAGPVINEILFDPLQSSGDDLVDQPDFVEIYNAGTRAVDLTGWSIGDEPNPATGKFNRYYFGSSTGGNVLEPGGYAVIAAENNGKNAGSTLTSFYDYLLGGTDAKIFIVRNSKTFSLNNDGDSVRLLDKNGSLVDRVAYTPNWHNPANRETRRLSIEKFNPLMTSDSPLSWSSSTDSRYGGTPGRINSVYVAPSRSEEVFTLSPNPFSPNGDHRHDLLRIAISLPADSYQLAVDVYDGIGARVRILAGGTPAGPATVLFWDGCDDGGQRLPAGNYRITMNAYGFSGSRYSTVSTATLVR
jgi:hypothetical protein